MAALTQEVREDSLPLRLEKLARALESRFLGKDEAIRLLVITAMAGEHAVLIGPPGTAKSALIRTFPRLLQARYFEYLLTPFPPPTQTSDPAPTTPFRSAPT